MQTYGTDFLPDQLDTIQALRDKRKEAGRDEPGSISISFTAPEIRSNWLMDIIFNRATDKGDTPIEAYRCYYSDKPHAIPFGNDTKMLEDA